MKAHPDKGGSEAKMAAVNEAYEVLSKPGKHTHLHTFLTLPYLVLILIYLSFLTQSCASDTTTATTRTTQRQALRAEAAEAEAAGTRSRAGHEAGHISSRSSSSRTLVGLEVGGVGSSFISRGRDVEGVGTEVGGGPISSWSWAWLCWLLPPPPSYCFLLLTVVLYDGWTKRDVCLGIFLVLVDSLWRRGTHGSHRLDRCVRVFVCSACSACLCVCFFFQASSIFLSFFSMLNYYVTCIYTVHIRTVHYRMYHTYLLPRRMPC